jgi:hypothetical protein
MGARAIVQKPPVLLEKPRKVFHPGKRAGLPTKAEQSIVAQFVADQPREVTESQVTSLSKLLRRSKDVVRGLIEKAREEFQDSAGFYVKAHRTAVEQALETTDRFGNRDAKALDAAMRGAQWAIENVSAEGVRIVDKAKDAGGPTGPRIMVNIALGGLNKKKDGPVMEATIVEAKVPPSEDV